MPAQKEHRFLCSFIPLFAVLLLKAFWLSSPSLNSPIREANPSRVTPEQTLFLKSLRWLLNAERLACPMDTSTGPNEPGATVVKAVAAVLWVQFEDGSTWGDAESSKQVLSVRSRKLGFLQRLVAEYYDNGETSFNAMLITKNLGVDT